MVWRRVEVDGAEVEALYLGGLTQQQVGERLGVSQPTIGRVLLERGVTIRPSGPRPSPAPDGVVDAFRRLGTVTAVVAEMGIPRSRVKRALSEAGVPVIKPVDVERAITMYEAGVDLLKIAAELKVNHRRVSARLREAGVPIRPPGTYPRLAGAGCRQRGTRHQSQRQIEVVMLHATATHLVATGFILGGIKAILYLIGGIIAAVICAVVAKAKGYSAILFGILGFFFSIITLIVVLVIPKRR